jgi:hypothetical protein
MSHMMTPVQRASEPVSRLYELGVRWGDAPTFSVFVGRVTGGTVRMIIVGKDKFDPQSTEVRRFKLRLAELSDLFGKLPNLGGIVRAELDSEGYPFMEMIRVGGDPFPFVGRSFGEASRRFMSLVSVMAQFHAEGIFFGDLHPVSFLADESLTPTLVGLLGLLGKRDFSSETPGDIFSFAPEVRKGEIATESSDVFSVCVLGALLFGCVFRADEEIQPTVVESRLRRDGVPEWLSNILYRGLAADPSKRPQSCVELMSELQTVRDASVSAPPIIKEILPSIRNSGTGLTTDEVAVFSPSVDSTNPGEPSSRRPRQVFILLVVLGIILAFLRFYLQGVSHEPVGGDFAKQSVLEQAGFSPGMSPEERIQFFERLSLIKDPSVHDVAISLVERAEDSDERVSIENWILERCESQGVRLAVATIRDWYGSNNLVRPIGFIEALRALDRTTPNPERAKSFSRIAQTDLATAIKLATALLIDTGGEDKDRRILSFLITGVGDDKDFLTRPLSLLLLSFRVGREHYVDNIDKTIDSLNTEELIWLLSRLARRGDDRQMIVKVLSRLNSRVDITEGQRKILDLALGSGDVPDHVRLAAIRLSGGGVKDEDIAALGGWSDVRAGHILLLLTQQQIPADKFRAIVDVLRGKEIESEPSSSILEAVGGLTDEQQNIGAKAAGYLFDVASKNRVPDMVDVPLVTKAFEIPGVVAAIVKSDCVPCIHIVLDLAPDKLSSAKLFNLLASPAPEIRSKALNLLAKYSDVGAVNLLRQSFEKEKEASVRKIYSELFPQFFGSQKPPIPRIAPKLRAAR